MVRLMFVVSLLHHPLICPPLFRVDSRGELADVDYTLDEAASTAVGRSADRQTTRC